jgi:hypothetical protein
MLHGLASVAGSSWFLIFCGLLPIPTVPVVSRTLQESSSGEAKCTADTMVCIAGDCFPCFDRYFKVILVDSLQVPAPAATGFGATRQTAANETSVSVYWLKQNYLLNR